VPDIVQQYTTHLEPKVFQKEIVAQVPYFKLSQIASNVVVCPTAVLPEQWSPRLFKITPAECLTQLLPSQFTQI